MPSRQEDVIVRQFVLTPAAGKRLIAKGICEHPAVRSALDSGTVVAIAGTTNGTVAEELLKRLGQDEDFDRSRFFRGVTLPPASEVSDSGRLPDQSQFPGDVVIANGEWRPGRTIFDVLDELKEGDVILKGANALDLIQERAAILIGHPKAGTVGAALQVTAGRRVRLILPVGVEKRIPGDLDELAAAINRPGAQGARLLPVPGEVFTELHAVRLLTGADAELIAAGGVGGAEGCVWIGLTGDRQAIAAADALLRAVADEPPFRI